MENTLEMREALIKIGHGQLLRVKSRDDIGLVTDCTLFNPRTQSEMSMSNKTAAMLIGCKETYGCRLALLTPNRDNSRAGYKELGCPDDGSEYYCMMQ